MRIAAFMRSILEKLEIKHKEHHSLSYHQLGRWDESMFNKEGIAELTYDITRYSDKDGRYHICFDYIDSKQGTTIKSISVLQDQVEISSILYDKVNPLKRINMYEPWYEVFIDIKSASRNEDKILKVIIEGPANGQDTCKGLVGIRRV